MADFVEYLNEFDAACALVANGKDLPTGNLRTKAALTSLCRVANQVRLEYAIIRELEEKSSIQIGAKAFTPTGGESENG